LVINPQKTIIPSTGASTTIYVVTIEYQGGIDDLQLKALEMGKERVNLIENMRDIETEARKIVSSDVDTEKEEREFAEEFFPDNIIPDSIDVESEEVKKPAAEKHELSDEVDSLLGKAVEPEPEPEPEPEDKTEPEEPEPITRDQLKIILDLKSNVLKINDPKAWAALIKKMKFKGVTKANGMTFEQGDTFINHLISLKTSPF